MCDAFTPLGRECGLRHGFKTALWLAIDWLEQTVKRYLNRWVMCLDLNTSQTQLNVVMGYDMLKCRVTNSSNQCDCDIDHDRDSTCDIDSDCDGNSVCDCGSIICERSSVWHNNGFLDTNVAGHLSVTWLVRVALRVTWVRPQLSAKYCRAARYRPVFENSDAKQCHEIEST